MKGPVYGAGASKGSHSLFPVKVDRRLLTRSSTASGSWYILIIKSRTGRSGMGRNCASVSSHGDTSSWQAILDEFDNLATQGMPVEQRGRHRLVCDHVAARGPKETNFAVADRTLNGKHI